MKANPVRVFMAVHWGSVRVWFFQPDLSIRTSLTRGYLCVYDKPGAQSFHITTTPY